MGFRVEPRRGPQPRPQRVISAQPPHVVCQLVRRRGQQPGLLVDDDVRVPPVFMAAIGTPSALASISTRLRDSGPRDGKMSIDACAIHAAAAA